MKKNLLILAMCLLGASSLNLNAQSTPQIPNSGFENWSTGQGYSVTALFISVPIYNSFSYPTNWNYLTYPVNETLTYIVTINVNTNVPLMKISQETSNVPEGSKAVKLESFMLQDIVSSTAYSLMSGELDPMYTTSVFPTVLSTGSLDLDRFLPIMNNVMGSGFSDISQLLPLLDTMDINNYISGGFPTDGVVPDRLTGSYKYTSAGNGNDNGGIIIFGTKYNNTTHCREVVGGGYSTNFTNTSTYTDFSVNYMSKHDIDPTHYTEIEPDSMIVVLISSCNDNPQQGSAFIVDNLNFERDTIVDPQVPDTCASVINLSASNITTDQATLSWSSIGTPMAWEYYYEIPNTTPTAIATTNNSTITLNNLQPDTDYNFYVRSKCNDTLYSDWRSTTFHTDILVADTCANVLNLAVSNITSDAATLSWSSIETPMMWEYYFEVANATPSATVGILNNTITLNDLQPDTEYHFYVRSKCDNDLFSDWSSITFRTDIQVIDTCAYVTNLTVTAIDTTHATLSWSSIDEPMAWEYYYEISNSTPSTIVSILNSTITLNDLQPNTEYNFYIRSKCDNDLFSDWSSISFRTDSLVQTGGDTLGVTDYLWKDLSIYPNPTTGVIHCTASRTVEQLVVFDLYGRKVMDAKCDQIDLSSLAPGLYIIEINHSVRKKIEKL